MFTCLNEVFFIADVDLFQSDCSLDGLDCMFNFVLESFSWPVRNDS